MRTKGISVALLIAGTLVLSACGADGVPEASSTTTAATVIDTPTPTPTPTATEAVPSVVAFEGDCRAAISDDDLVTVLGEGAALEESDPVRPISVLTTAAAQAAGTLACTWRSALSADYVHAVMSPLAQIPDDVVAGARPATCDSDGYGGTECSVSLAVGEAWLTVMASDEEALNESMALLGAALVTQTPQAGSRPEGTWAAPVCTDLVQLAQETFAGSSVAEGYPSDNNPSGPYLERLTAFGSETYCGLQGLGDAQAAARIYFFDGVDVAGVEHLLPVTDVEGADAAYGDADGPQIALVGPNAIVVDNAPATVARALLEALVPAQTLRPADQNDEES